MQLEEEDIMDSSLLEFADKKPMASLTPAEEATLLDDDSWSQGAWAAAPKPECSASLGEMVADPHDMQNQSQPLPLGFELQPLVHGPSQFEDIPSPPGFGLPQTPRLRLLPALETGPPPTKGEETPIRIP